MKINSLEYILLTKKQVEFENFLHDLFRFVFSDSDVNEMLSTHVLVPIYHSNYLISIDHFESIKYSSDDRIAIQRMIDIYNVCVSEYILLVQDVNQQDEGIVSTNYYLYNNSNVILH